MEARIDCEASNAIFISTEGGISHEIRHQRLDVIDHFHGIRARLALDGENHAAHALEPSHSLVVFHAVNHIADCSSRTGHLLYRPREGR